MARTKQTAWKSWNEKTSWKQLSLLASHSEKSDEKSDEKNRKKIFKKIVKSTKTEFINICCNIRYTSGIL